MHRCAAALGVRPGDRVARMLPNLPQLVITFFGALAVNTNPTSTAREMQQRFAE